MFKYDVTVLFVFCAFVYDTCKCEECPDVETMKDVDVKKLSGVWYFIASDDEDHDDIKCGKEKLTINDLRILNGISTYINTTSNAEISETYSMTLNKEADSAIFNTQLVYNNEKHEFDLCLLDTDYDNYAIFWWCVTFEDEIYTEITIQSRTKTLSDDLLRKVYEVIDKNNLDRHNLKQMVQDCD